MGDLRKKEVVLEFQNYIETPPVKPKQLYAAACSSDTITIDSWREIWIKNYLANHDRFKSFKEFSVGKLFQTNKNKPCLVVGSGPSLSYNGPFLKDRGDIKAISCLHNYHFFEDRGIDIDLYVTLDAGPIVLEEVSEGGSKTEEEYWASTKNKKVAAFVGTDPKFFEKWQGEVYLFNAPIPDPEYINKSQEREKFGIYVANGGNVLGACVYIAKAIMGSNPISFMGADFSFGYNSGRGHKFHSWDSKYDAQIGNVMRGVDVFGNKVLTWPSYFNFKNFFDYISLQVPGIWINCTEGGMLGAYPDGNLMSLRQMTLKSFIDMYQMSELMRTQCEQPELMDNKVLF